MPRSNKKRRNRQDPGRTAAVPGLPGLSQWLSVPVALAFALGVILMALATGSGLPAVILFWGAVFLLSFSAAHLLTRAIVSRRRSPQ
ncbi:MAG TPA: hypothetical protein VIO14_12285 [Dehalococcoidia bacterium]